MRDWSEYIFDKPCDFEEQALYVFDHQFYHNHIYRDFCIALNRDNSGVLRSQDIPLLPIEAFRDSDVTGSYVEQADLVFKSSGTTSMKPSVHKIASASMYRQAIIEGLRQFYDIDQLVIWGYVPHYIDNPYSSLIWMIKQMVDHDMSGLSRFLPLHENPDAEEISAIQESGQQVVIFGAAFGFLDLLDNRSYRLPEQTIIMETGGMKTHRREITREKLHQKLAEGFGLQPSQVHSEYGMTEMLSQAYALGGSWYKTPFWLKITIRNPENPLEIQPPGEEGLIGVIDLANVHSCSFILTQDTGIQNEKGDFKVTGRWKYANLRGCNFLIEEE